jgi:hypothetical protein
MVTVIWTSNAGLSVDVKREVLSGGECFRVEFKGATEGDQVAVWLNRGQLHSLGFAVSVAEQEAEQADYLAADDYPGADYYPEGGPDGDENSFRRPAVCPHGYEGEERALCSGCAADALAPVYHPA